VYEKNNEVTMQVHQKNNEVYRASYCRSCTSLY